MRKTMRNALATLGLAALAMAAAGLQDGGSAYGRYQWRDNSWLVTLPEDAGGKTYLVSALGDVIECR